MANTPLSSLSSEELKAKLKQAKRISNGMVIFMVFYLGWMGYQMGAGTWDVSNLWQFLPFLVVFGSGLLSSYTKKIKSELKTRQEEA